jgi:hypothetical protein
VALTGRQYQETHIIAIDAKNDAAPWRCYAKVLRYATGQTGPSNWIRAQLIELSGF